MDKRVDFGCSKRRPDAVYDFTYFYICLEIDEDQHRSRSCECEQGRMIQIHQDFGGSPVLFIRYNPDTYKDHIGKRHVPSKNRLKFLLDTMNGLKNRISIEKCWETHLSVMYLYYDGFNGEIQIEKINY